MVPEIGEGIVERWVDLRWYEWWGESSCTCPAWRGRGPPAWGDRGGCPWGLRGLAVHRWGRVAAGTAGRRRPTRPANRFNRVLKARPDQYRQCFQTGFLSVARISKMSQTSNSMLIQICIANSNVTPEFFLLLYQTGFTVVMIYKCASRIRNL